LPGLLFEQLRQIISAIGVQDVTFVIPAPGTPGDAPTALRMTQIRQFGQSCSSAATIMQAMDEVRQQIDLSYPPA
jgi:hypothetical protein